MPKLYSSRTGTEAQVKSDWAPPSGILGELSASSARRAEALAGRVHRPYDGAGRSTFAAALSGSSVAVIAEIKRASPSRGPINPGLDAGAQARRYESLGAAAISVLTEPSRFGGSLDDITAVMEASSLPVIRKDFLVHPAQVEETAASGAAAALLIVRALAPGLLEEMAAAARSAGIESLFEVRDAGELERALAAGALIVGVNCRNLETLEIDDALHARLVPAIPNGVVAIAESGVASRDDVVRAAEAGADAVLVGSSLSRADSGNLLQSLSGVPRRRRVGGN